MTHEELQDMFEKVWDERNALLGMVGYTAIEYPKNAMQVTYAIGSVPLSGLFVPRKDYEAVLKALTAKKEQ